MCKRAFYFLPKLRFVIELLYLLNFLLVITLEKKCKNIYLYKININLFISVLHKAHSDTVEFLVINF